MTDKPAHPQYDWLAMIFLSGDNDLFTFGEDLVREAQRVGSSSRVAVVAQYDPVDPEAVTRRGQVLPGRWDAKEIGLTDGDPASIIDFIQYAKREFPAEKRMLFLWDHGNGWQTTHVFESVMAATDRLTGADTAALAIEAVFKGMGPAPGIDVLCFDSCLMAMIEVAYQLRDRVQYIVASENVVPADSGWPYDAILRTLSMRPQITPGQVVCAMVDGFSGSYNGSDQPITLSALRVKRVEMVVKALDGLSRELIAAWATGAQQKVLFARRYTQSFGNPDYIDIISFCDELKRQLPDTDVDRAAAEVKKAVTSFILGATRGSASSISGAHGVSIYFPDRPMSPLYHKLDFAKTSTCLWATFLALVTPKMVAPHPMERPEEAISQDLSRSKPEPPAWHPVPDSHEDHVLNRPPA